MPACTVTPSSRHQSKGETRLTAGLLRHREFLLSLIGKILTSASLRDAPGAQDDSAAQVMLPLFQY